MKKNNIKTTIGAILIITSIVAVIVSAIWSAVFQIMNPDMTNMRILIENPYPTIIAIISLAVFLFSGKLMNDIK